MEKKVKICPECKETKKVKKSMARYKAFVSEIESTNVELGAKAQKMLETIKVSENSKRNKVAVFDLKRIKK